MPTGRMKRIDQQRKVAYIVRRGRTLAAPLAEVDTKARVPNARVEFRLVRHHGDESAADVRLRTGTRTSRRQRRFGDLTGASRPGSKVATAAAERYRVDSSSPPFRVVEAWLEAMGDRDLDGAVSLYRPDAVLHSPDDDLSGLHRLRAALEHSPLTGLDPDSAEIYGLGRYVRVDYPGQDVAGGHDHGVSLIVDRGEIVEQWIDVDPDGEYGEGETPTAPPLQLVMRGTVTGDAQAYAGSRIEHLITTVGRPVRFVRLKLTAIDNPGHDRPAMAEVVLDLDRTIIRAHAAAPTFTEAVDRVIDRLQVRIRHDRSRRRARRLDRAPIGRPDRPQPAGPRKRPESGHPEIVRHRSFAPDELTIDEAVWDLGLLDYEFLLFVEADSGDDAFLTRDDNDQLLLRFRRPTNVSISCVADVVVAETPAPLLKQTEAVELLEVGGDRFVFFVDRLTERGNVVYRRLDGHYGLITPPDTSPYDGDDGDG